jgi:hypothetical protein
MLYVLLSLILPFLSPASHGATADTLLAREWPKIESPTPNVGSREIMDFILEAGGGTDSAQYGPQIEQAFSDLERMQDRDPDSKTYGNFCWYWHETKPGDRNAVEFVTQQAVLLRLQFARNLSPAAQGSLDQMLRLVVEGIHRQKVDVGYTNIFLMKSWNLMALGQALGNPALSQEGDTMLDQWMTYTARNGIREYLSPTYYGPDLDSLGLMARYIADPGIKAKAERCLRLFWRDIAANWFAPCGRLGGAHGRDYDYLTGHGDLDRHLFDAGWIDETQYKPDPRHVFADATRWVPPAALHETAVAEVPRLVYQKWDAPAAAWASQYVGHHFSIGVSGCSQGPEDKPFAINLAGPQGPATVMVNFFMDGRNDPYGKEKVATGASGHPKAHHLFPFFSAVQSGPEVLFLASSPLPGGKVETEPVCLLSHMDLPAGAAVWTGSGAADLSQKLDALPGNLCFLRMGDVAVGIRFVFAQATDGSPCAAWLINDGDAYGARRLTVTHSLGPPGSGRGTVAVFVRAAEGLDDAGFAAFRREFLATKTAVDTDGKVVRLKAGGLSLEDDVASGTVLQSSGAPVETAPMTVNGNAFGL